MSLIGSLEDLGLGDILQIISLSQKSGVLVIRSEEGEGRIAFLDGLVRGAALKGGPEDLRAVMIGGGFLDEESFDAASRDSREQGISLEEAISGRTSISTERIDSLRRECVESAVIRMFQWATGEFSFDVRDGPEEGDPPLFLPTGINAQYLAMEGSRIDDEGGFETEPDLDEGSEEDELSAHEMFGVEPPESEFSSEPEAAAEMAALPVVLAEVLADDAVSEGDEAQVVTELAEDVGDVPLEADFQPDEPLLEPVPLADDAVLLAEADAERLSEDSVASTTQAPAEIATFRNRPVIVIDSELEALEWTKAVLQDSFSRIHIFQQTELGLGRIRQYLARAEAPILLLSPSSAGDPLSGIADSTDFVRRIKVQAPRTCVLWLTEEGGEPLGSVGPADGQAVRPALYQIRNRGAAHHLERLAGDLLSSLHGQLVESGGESSDADSDAVSPESLQRLKAATASLSEASSRGEVLPLVIRFAGESFHRVAMFVVRDEEAIGMAQRGLPDAGGPEDEGLREIRIRADSSPWITEVLARRTAVARAPSDPGDRAFCAALGREIPGEAYLAPIESAGHVVALLYADHLPAQRPVGETNALEVVLHHAGLALDRASLERALNEIERPQEA